MEEKMKMSRTLTPTSALHEYSGLAAYNKVTFKKFTLNQNLKESDAYLTVGIVLTKALS